MFERSEDRVRVAPSSGASVAAARGLDHSQRVYDWWASHDVAYSAFVDAYLLGRAGTFRSKTTSSLDLRPGDRVLDLGCGPGPNFGRLANRVGPTGTVLGVDTSEQMARVAADRGAELDCRAAVLRADAARLPVPDESVDAVCATLSLSAMPDVPAVVEEAHRALRPGGTVAVLDVQPFQPAYARWLNPLIEPVAGYVTNWYPDADVIGAVERIFEACRVERFHAGSVYVATARKRV